MVAYAFAAAAPDSDRARGWDGVAAQSSARRGVGTGLRRIIGAARDGTGLRRIAPDSDRARGWG